MAERHWNLRTDAAVILGYGRREIVQGLVLSKICAMEITTEPPNYVTPVKMKFFTEGGAEVEIEEPDEIAEMRDILINETQRQGGRLIYIP